MATNSRGFINTPSGKKEIVIVSSSQLPLSADVKPLKLPLHADSKPIATLQQTSTNSINISHSQYALRLDHSSTAPSAAPMAYRTTNTNIGVPEHAMKSFPSSMPSFAMSSPMRPAPAPMLSMPAMKRSHDLDHDFSHKFPRSSEKSKGLRHFSTRVCDKVREKGITNYNEVADELVQEFFETNEIPSFSREKQLYDQKNIRRRVYDALNVLMAMNIITKERKEIKWVGLPSSTLQECLKLEDEKEKRLDRIRQKTEQLKDLVVQMVSLKSLIERNKTAESNLGKPAQHTTLSLPYVIVTTDKKTEVDCSISQDKTEYLFKFNQPFEIQEDGEVLKKLGLACGLERGQVELSMIPKIRSYLPPALQDYVDLILSGELEEKFIPLPLQMLRQQVPQMRHSETVKSQDTSRSMDAADLEVAMTLSGGQSSASAVATAVPLAATVPKQPTPSSGAAASYGRHSAQQHHSYFAAQAASSSGDTPANAALLAERPLTATFEEADEEGASRSGYSTTSSSNDYESVGSNSNPGY